MPAQSTQEFTVVCKILAAGYGDSGEEAQTRVEIFPAAGMKIPTKVTLEMPKAERAPLPMGEGWAGLTPVLR